MAANVEYQSAYCVKIAFPTWARSDTDNVRQRKIEQILNDFNGFWTKSNMAYVDIKDAIRVEWECGRAKAIIRLPGWTIEKTGYDKELFNELIWDMLELVRSQI